MEENINSLTHVHLSLSVKVHVIISYLFSLLLIKYNISCFLYLGLKVFLAPEAVHASLCLDPEPKRQIFSQGDSYFLIKTI